MILQALYEYYQRKASDPNNHIAQEGWEWKEIPYRLVINKEGRFAAIEDMREGEGRIKRAKKFLVPQTVKRTVGKCANLLWDNIEYALGANPRNRDDVEERFNLFFERIEKEIDVEKYPNIKSLQIFLQNDPVKQIETSTYVEIWTKMLEVNPFVVFKIEGELHNSLCDDIKDSVLTTSSDRLDGLCLITGSNASIARLHPSIKGVRGGNTQGGALVSYNLAPFNSYGKKQNYNAPVSDSASFAYTTALNLLLQKDSNNKVNIADTTIVFWSEKQSNETTPEEEAFAAMFGFQKKDEDNPDRNVNVIENFINSIFTGNVPRDSTNHFYILGLSPNAARISVRFWKAPSIEDFGKNIKKHFDDFEIVRGPKEQKYLSLYQILSATALQYKMENVPPNLAGKVIESIIDGTPYPTSLLQQCIRRIRAEQNVNRSRASILKAYFNRFNRIHNQNKKEITMSLDLTNINVAYRVGRLFAALEKIQEEANPGINATIRDRFYGSASSSPITVFPRLLSLKNSHLKKLKEGRKIYFEKLIGEIVNEMNSFPTNLSLNEQANFAIGYYHQRQDFFTKKSDKEQIEIESTNN